VPGSESKSFGSTPALDLLLSSVCLVHTVEVFEIEQPHGKSCLGIQRALAVVVLGKPMLEIARAADIERSVGALEDVHVGHDDDPRSLKGAAREEDGDRCTF